MLIINNHKYYIRKHLNRTVKDLKEPAVIRECTVPAVQKYGCEFIKTGRCNGLEASLFNKHSSLCGCWFMILRAVKTYKKVC